MLALVLLLFVLSQTIARGAASTEAVESIVSKTKENRKTTMKGTKDPESLLIVFSDVDGTLLHYNDDDGLEPEADYPVLKLPPSSTGMRGIISHDTLKKCREIRKAGTKLVIISGMRTTTLLNRLPFLPRADAYCSEAGGRIFYPTSTTSDFSVQPERFSSSTEKDLQTFGLVEDTEWRRVLQRGGSVTANSYHGNQLAGAGDEQLPTSDRSGELWTFASRLEELGFVLDTKGYSTCFRVNRKQQNTEHLFEKLLGSEIDLPEGLSISTNLGCIDVYPSESGKKNCCLYLANKFGESLPHCLERRCVCLCDDDNDIEMAMACRHAYLPEVTSDSMKEAALKNPSHFTIASTKHAVGTKATDRALSMVLDL